MFHITRRGLPLVAASLLAGTQTAFGQAMPAGTVRIIVPFNPGGISDILARSLAQQMTLSLGSTVVVENRAGANGSIGAGVAARADARRDDAAAGRHGYPCGEPRRHAEHPL